MLKWRRASRRDLPLLASWNRRLIVDEKADTPRGLAFLQLRMGRWLSGSYRAVLFFEDKTPVAYALYRVQLAGIYIRQLYVDRPYRRRGVGRSAVRLLLWKVFPKRKVIDVDVLLHNKRGMAFWHAQGFKDRVMRMARPGRAAKPAKRKGKSGKL